MALLLFLLLQLIVQPFSSLSFASLCRTSCNNIPIKYPFGIDNGCGAPQYRSMLNCSASSSVVAAAGDLFFITPSGNYKVQSIDYDDKTITIYDPSMSTCSILQPHHDFVMTDLQSVIVPPTPDTVFVLMNCSIDSPVLNHYKSLCFNFSGHSCDELYGSCTSFKLFHVGSYNISSNSTSLPPPPCCFTGYNTVRVMSMNILDCTHYTSVYNSDSLKGVGPVDWLYGMKLSFSVPDTGCERCAKSGGTCGYDADTQGLVCICSSAINSTRECGSVEGTGESHRQKRPSKLLRIAVLVVGAAFLLV